MVGCVLTGHGTFANGLVDALKMIAGEQEAFVPVPFIEAGAATYPETLAATISDLLDTTAGVLVFCWLRLLLLLVARELSISVLSLRLSQKMTSSETMEFK